MTRKILVICLLFLLLGCKRIENNDNYIEYVTNCFKNKKITNNVDIGYKYYIPKGVKKINDYDYNKIFLNKDTKIYLYVDIISHFYNKELNLENSDDSYYYQKFNHNGNGYLKIEEKGNEYFVNIVYNYARIEFYSNKENLAENITLASIIINSIEYNKITIEKILEGDLGDYLEFTYELDKPENSTSNFTQILEEYVQKEEKDKNLPGE